MSHTPHQLAEEFPEFADRIHALKVGDQHFAKLVDAYNDVNEHIHRVESRLAPVDDLTEEEMRKRRLRLKDEIHEILLR
jgi:uncharacterized protein YdcH (DUF465 family)